MKIINDPEMQKKVLEKEDIHFSIIPSVINLLSFEKGELLNHPLKPLDQFLYIVEGNIIIYNITPNGDIRYITRSGNGTLLGDMEFSGAESQILFTEAADSVLCLSIPFKENHEVLENDPVFLRFVMSHLARKLFFSSNLDVMVETLEEKVLLYLRKIEPCHEIRSVNETMQILHCSRRQLQRVLKKLCDEKILTRANKGRYRLNND